MVRQRHPLEGQSSAVLCWTHRAGSLHLLLVLPDGTRSLVPSAWTDLATRQSQPTRAPELSRSPAHSPILGSLSDLIRLRTIVDALLRRPASSISEPGSAAKEVGERRHHRPAAEEPCETCLRRKLWPAVHAVVLWLICLVKHSWLERPGRLRNRERATGAGPYRLTYDNRSNPEAGRIAPAKCRVDE